MAADGTIDVAPQWMLTATLLLPLIMSSYRDICYSVFSNKDLPHPAAPALLQCVARAGSSAGLVEVDASLSEEDAAWLQSKLREIGFEDDESQSALRADPELIDRLIKDQNSARVLVHKEAQTRREALLDELLRDASSERPPPSKL